MSGARLRVGLACLLAGGLGTAGPARSDSSGLLFHVSFDDGRRAVRAAGAPEARFSDWGRPRPSQGQAIEGVVGAARRFEHPPQLHYNAERNYLPQRGTVAFHVRLGGLRRDVATLLTVSDLQTGRVDDHLRLVRDRDGHLVLRLQGTPGSGISVRSRLPLGKGWHHVAWSWDAAEGGTLYLDGVGVGEVERSWWTAGVDPHLISLPAWDSFPPSAHLDVDELRIYDRRLGASAVRALAGDAGLADGAVPDRPARDDAAWREHRRAELGWQPQQELPRLGSAPLRWRQVAPEAARAWGVDCSAVIDGRSGGGFPRCATPRQGVPALELSAAGPFELVAVDGAAVGRLEVGDGSGQALEGAAARQRVRLPEPRRGPIRFRPAGRRQPRGIGEVRLFARGGDAPSADTIVRYASPRLLPAGPSLALGPEDRQAVATGAEPGAAGRLELPAWRRQHWRLDGLAGASLDGLSLVLVAEGPLREGALRVELSDPRIPARHWLSFDLRIEARPEPGPQLLRVDIDTLGRRVPEEGGDPWLTLLSEQELSLRVGGEGESTRVELWRGAPERVVAEHRAADIAVLKARFRGFSEQRPWNPHERPEKTLAPQSRAMAELFGLLEELRRQSPEDPRLEALWWWTHKYAEDTSPIRLPEAPGAPYWARLQREVFATAHRILVDWIDRRATPLGELGDGYGDDTDFVQNFPNVALIRDPDARLAEAAARLADRGYGGGYLRDGLNVARTDTLHAYESGLNVQPVAALLQWGEPRFLLRMYESLRAVRDRLMAPAGPGRLRFRSSLFGVDAIVDDDGFAFDSPDNALMLHPAAFLAWRHRDPEAVRLLIAWTERWLELFRSVGRPGRLPVKVRADGRVLQWAGEPDHPAFADLLYGLQELSGSPRYRRAAELLLRAPDRKGRIPAPSARALYRLLEQERFADQRARWAERAGRDLGRISADGLGGRAYRAHLGAETGGGEEAAIRALEATLRGLRRLEPAYAAWEPKGDRVWLPTHVAAAMAYGDEPDARNQVWPRHRVSYEGFSDLAARVRRAEAGRLRLELYSFAPVAETGRIRVWIPEAGRWRLRAGDGEERSLRLHRGASFAWRVPARSLQTLELERLGDAGEAHHWPDLAFELREREAGRLRLRLYNLGLGEARDVRVVLEEAGGGTLAERRVARLAGVRDAQVAQVDLELSFEPGDRGSSRAALRIRVDPEQRIRELDEENNARELAPLEASRSRGAAGTSPAAAALGYPAGPPSSEAPCAS